MECNKDEARRAIDIAEKKISDNDYDGAKKFVNKAQRLYPQLDGLKQVLMMIDVYISALNREGGEADWYGVLGVAPLADDEAMKKQYKKLALLLHPDKNRFNGAEGAFKLVLQAWDLLSDKEQRIVYDRKRKFEQVKQTKSSEQKTTPKPHEPKGEPKHEPKGEPKHEPKGEPKNEPKREPSSWKPKDVTIFLTVCNRCNTCYEYSRKFYLNKTSRCQNCNQDFVATEITPEMVNGRRVIRFTDFQFTSKSTSDSSSSTTSASKSTSDASASDSAKAANQAQERMKRWLEEQSKNLAAARGNAYSHTNDAERLFKKRATNSIPMTSGDPKSTHEAQRLFGKHMTTENENSTHEAQRLFKTPLRS